MSPIVEQELPSGTWTIHKPEEQKSSVKVEETDWVIPLPAPKRRRTKSPNTSEVQPDDLPPERSAASEPSKKRRNIGAKTNLASSSGTRRAVSSSLELNPQRKLKKLATKAPRKASVEQRPTKSIFLAPPPNDRLLDAMSNPVKKEQSELRLPSPPFTSLASIFERSPSSEDNDDEIIGIYSRDRLAKSWPDAPKPNPRISVYLADPSSDDGSPIETTSPSTPPPRICYGRPVSSRRPLSRKHASNKFQVPRGRKHAKARNVILSTDGRSGSSIQAEGRAEKGRGIGMPGNLLPTHVNPRPTATSRLLILGEPSPLVSGRTAQGEHIYHLGSTSNANVDIEDVESLTQKAEDLFTFFSRQHPNIKRECDSLRARVAELTGELERERKAHAIEEECISRLTLDAEREKTKILEMTSKLIAQQEIGEEYKKANLQLTENLLEVHNQRDEVTTKLLKSEEARRGAETKLSKAKNLLFTVQQSLEST